MSIARTYVYTNTNKVSDVVAVMWTWLLRIKKNSKIYKEQIQVDMMYEQIMIRDTKDMFNRLWEMHASEHIWALPWL